MVVYHLKKFSGEYGWKLNGARHFVPFPQKFPAAAEHLKRWSCVARRNVQNGNSLSISSEHLCGRFSVNGTDLFKQ